jgi:CheY-like chemotaxis protein
MHDSAPATKPQVLIVDDDQSIRLLVRQILRRDGFETAEAEDGRVAIQRLDIEQFDALVLDLMMPHVDGLAVLDHLASSAPDMIERTVLVTAYPRAAARERVHHVCTVLSKPFEIAELLSAVRSCVAAGRR